MTKNVINFLVGCLAVMSAASIYANKAKCESESFARQKTAEKAAQTEYDNWPGHATYKHLYANFEKARDRYNEVEKRFIEVNNTHIRALQECSKIRNKDENDACVSAALKPLNAAREERDAKKKLQENAARREVEFRPQNVAAREKMDAAKQAAYKAGAEERRKCK
ncbi:MAG TPA: hypothetical protein PKM44_12305 [Turneriella sp.]|nr:hypothetical protein [Turneriella sp.]HNA78285.1 hypothetical protein [Turneriella sp.]HNE21018.1 hypothetical protein [Turneriella sp.]HNJ66007.1 hypothetical protein [Turneriella sp.]HNL11289.1 hypothetical protein [Turneriella sp.]